LIAENKKKFDKDASERTSKSKVDLESISNLQNQFSANLKKAHEMSDAEVAELQAKMKQMNDDHDD
jgi:hypothetical protein